jgi:hypothetical protein
VDRELEFNHVTVEFDRLSDDPPMGPTSTSHSTPGAEIIAALEGFSHQHSLAIPVLRALLTLSAMQESAGLPPRREIRIDAVPAEPLPQDTLSTHRSESVHPTPYPVWRLKPLLRRSPSRVLRPSSVRSLCSSRRVA